MKQDQMIALLVEELGEATQAAGKLLRFGIDNINPETGVSAISKLQEELGDVLASIELLSESKIIDIREIEKRIPIKLEKVKKWGAA